MWVVMRPCGLPGLSLVLGGVVGVMLVRYMKDLWGNSVYREMCNGVACAASLINGLLCCGCRQAWLEHFRAPPEEA